MVNSYAKDNMSVIFTDICVYIPLHKQKNMKIFFKSALLLTLSLLTLTNDVNAQEKDNTMDSVKLVRKKLYWSSGLDMMLFSTSQTEKILPTSTGLTPLRFTYLLNFGFNLNYDLSKNVALFTGIGFKNIGFTEKFTANDSTVKRRVLAIGAPIGIKFGNIRKQKYGFIGAGGDVPFNYKEKGYIKRGNKDKFNEWFSDRTPLFMPYVFAGIAFTPVTLKFQYYTGSFLNTSYTESVTVGGTTVNYTPYMNFVKNNIMMVSLGFDLRYSKKSKKVPVGEPVKQTM